MKTILWAIATLALAHPAFASEPMIEIGSPRAGAGIFQTPFVDQDGNPLAGALVLITRDENKNVVDIDPIIPDGDPNAEVTFSLGFGTSNGAHLSIGVILGSNFEGHRSGILIEASPGSHGGELSIGWAERETEHGLFSWTSTRDVKLTLLQSWNLYQPSGSWGTLGARYLGIQADYTTVIKFSIGLFTRVSPGLPGQWDWVPKLGLGMGL